MKENKYLQSIIKLCAYWSARFTLMLVLMVAMLSCGEDNEASYAPLDIGTLSASKAAVVIDFDTPTEEAIVFLWHAEETPIIQYELVFSSGTNSDTVEVLSEVSKKFIHAQFNKILVDKLHLEIGTPANIEVVVRAKVVNSNKEGSSNVITVSATPSPKIAEPTLETVTLTAARTEAVIDMANPAGETATFSWGDAKNEFIEYKVVLSSGTKSATIDVVSDVSKEFTNAELNNILIDKLQLEVGISKNIEVVVHAKVTISDKTVSSNTVTLSVIPSSKTIAPPAYTQMWIVGNATPNGWDIGNPNVMVNDPTNVYQFKYNEVLNAGEFKIPVTTGNWGADFYMPPTNHPALSSTDVNFVPGGNPDNKWNITDAGAYKVLLNISSSPFIKITPFTPYEHIYILGDATTVGWDVNNPMPMTIDPSDPNIFTWTGELKSTGRGQFRFPLATGDSNESFFIAPSSGGSITETKLAFTSNGISANNFKVKEGEEGTYNITINQLKETISIVKQ